MPAVYVKPAAGGRVRMPDREFKPMPAEGAWVQRHDDYYNRLLVSGDLTICDPPAEATTTTTNDAKRVKEK